MADMSILASVPKKPYRSISKPSSAGSSVRKEFQKRDSGEHGFIGHKIVSHFVSVVLTYKLVLHGFQQVGQHKFRLDVHYRLI